MSYTSILNDILIGKISVHPIGYRSHTISHVYRHPMLFPMLSCACPGRFKCGPATAQKLPRSDSDAPQFESNAAVSHPVRLSVFFGLELGCSGLLIHTRRRGSLFLLPPSPLARGQHESVAPSEGTVLLPPLPPRVIRRWREIGGCAGRAAAARAFWRGYRRPPADMPSDAYAT